MIFKIVSFFTLSRFVPSCFMNVQSHSSRVSHSKALADTEPRYVQYKLIKPQKLSSSSILTRISRHFSTQSGLQPRERVNISERERKVWAFSSPPPSSSYATTFGVSLMQSSPISAARRRRQHLSRQAPAPRQTPRQAPAPS